MTPTPTIPPPRAFAMSPTLFGRAEARGIPLDLIARVLSEGRPVHADGASELHWAALGCNVRVVTVAGRAVSCYWQSRSARRRRRSEARPEALGMAPGPSAAPEAVQGPPGAPWVRPDDDPDVRRQYAALPLRRRGWDGGEAPIESRGRGPTTDEEEGPESPLASWERPVRPAPLAWAAAVVVAVAAAVGLGLFIMS